MERDVEDMLDVSRVQTSPLLYLEARLTGNDHLRIRLQAHRSKLQGGPDCIETSSSDDFPVSKCIVL